jgi:HEAT repeat protein
MRAILADPFWVAADPHWANRLVDLMKQLDDGGERNALVLTLLQAPDLAVDLLAPAVREFSPGALGGAEIVQALLEANFESEDKGRRELASFALRGMTSSMIADREWLERAARSGNSQYQYSALKAIGELADPAYLPLLEELLQTGAASPNRVAHALSGYLSNEAGELLLVAATKLSGEPLDQCLAHIEKIRAYQEARERWATRRVQGQVRAEVVGDLLAKLDADSDEVRVQAIRALATWEAVEAMPRLIELTSARSASVAQAAREALDRLNAPPKDN